MKDQEKENVDDQNTTASIDKKKDVKSLTETSPTIDEISVSGTELLASASSIDKKKDVKS